MAQLRGALFDLLFKGFKCALQAQFAFAQVDQAVTRLVLATTAAQSSADQADQGHRVEGPLQEGHIAEQATEVGRTVLFAAAVMGHQHDGHIRPSGLLVQFFQQRLQIDTAQGFGGNDQQTCTFFHRVAQHRQVGRDDAGVTGFVEHHQRQ